MNFKFKKILNELKVLIILVIIAFTVKTTLIEIYVVPTGSMEDTILTGDMLIGNKFIYGMRTPTWIGIPYTRIGFNIPWFRLPKFKDVSNGDVTIFEFPRDPFQKYVKRCIGIPADTIRIDLGNIIVNDDTMRFPEKGKFIKGISKPEEKDKLYSSFTGNKDNISTFIVPFKGMNIDFNNISDWLSTIVLLVQDGNEVKLGEKIFTMEDPYEIARTHGFLKYKLLRIIKNSRKALLDEQKSRSLFIRSLYEKYEAKKLINPWNINFGTDNDQYLLDNITINGQSMRDLNKYELKKDYYFFIGDNRDSSYDSRYWGFVPNDQILGTPLFAIINIFNFKLRLKVVD